MIETFRDFIYPDIDFFPEEDCTVQNERESDVFESPNEYLVLYIDTRFPKEKCITYARPYIYKEEDGSKTYGWIANNSQLILSNIENSCRLEHEVVIGFIEVDDDYIKDDEMLFEQLKYKIERQWK